MKKILRSIFPFSKFSFGLYYGVQHWCWSTCKQNGDARFSFRRGYRCFIPRDIFRSRSFILSSSWPRNWSMKRTSFGLFSINWQEIKSTWLRARLVAFVKITKRFLSSVWRSRSFCPLSDGILSWWGIGDVWSSMESVGECGGETSQTIYDKCGWFSLTGEDLSESFEEFRKTNDRRMFWGRMKRSSIFSVNCSCVFTPLGRREKRLR